MLQCILGSMDFQGYEIGINSAISLHLNRRPGDLWREFDINCSTSATDAGGIGSGTVGNVVTCSYFILCDPWAKRQSKMYFNTKFLYFHCLLGSGYIVFHKLFSMIQWWLCHDLESRPHDLDWRSSEYVAAEDIYPVKTVFVNLLSPYNDWPSSESHFILNMLWHDILTVRQNVVSRYNDRMVLTRKRRAK